MFVDYHFREISHPSLIEEAQKVSGFGLDDISLSHSRSRPWQKEFKQKVLRKMPQCPFTFITDERLLIGSHIKPVAVCYKEDRLDQAKDPLNGLSLTPTYDKLFNDGYITFSDKSELICGTKLSNFTWASININPRLRKTMKIDPKGREEYLEYHRDKVFNG